jgi:hypothetical protein
LPPSSAYVVEEEDRQELQIHVLSQELQIQVRNKAELGTNLVADLLLDLFYRQGQKHDIDEIRKNTDPIK